MTVRPRRKSGGDTQPGVTIYSRRSGITTGPPPKIMVPAKQREEKSEKDFEGRVVTAWSVKVKTNVIARKTTIPVPTIQVIEPKSPGELLC